MSASVRRMPADRREACGERPRELRPLTSLRGLAAALLLLYHMTPPATASRGLDAALRHGYLLVDLFFVLSGFVIALAHQDLLRAPISQRGFALFVGRRLARIYPLYLASSVAALAVFVWRDMRGFEGQMLRPPLLVTELANLLMIQNWGISGSLNGAAWSISAEWSAYLLFPLFAWGVFRAPPRLCACILAGVLLCLATLAWCPDLWLWRDAMPRRGPLDRVSGLSVAPLLRCWTEFCLGMFGFRGFRLARRLSPSASAAVCAMTMAALAAAFSLPGSDLVVVLLYVPLVVSLAAPARWSNVLLGNGLLHRMGVYSYSFYMLFLFGVECRAPITRALSRVLGPPGFALVFASTLVLVFAAAAVSFHLIERPLRALARSRMPAADREGGCSHRASPHSAATCISPR